MAYLYMLVTQSVPKSKICDFSGRLDRSHGIPNLCMCVVLDLLQGIAHILYLTFGLMSHLFCDMSVTLTAICSFVQLHPKQMYTILMNMCFFWL